MSDWSCFAGRWLTAGSRCCVCAPCGGAVPRRAPGLLGERPVAGNAHQRASHWTALRRRKSHCEDPQHTQQAPRNPERARDEAVARETKGGPHENGQRGGPEPARVAGCMWAQAGGREKRQRLRATCPTPRTGATLRERGGKHRRPLPAVKAKQTPKEMAKAPGARLPKPSASARAHGPRQAAGRSVSDSEPPAPLHAQGPPCARAGADTTSHRLP